MANRLREMILGGDFVPGSRVTEAALAERLGVSRTPVRNILPGLAAEGLLVPVGKRGFAVRAFTVDECIEALELRSILEGMAGRLLVRRGVPTEVLESLNGCLISGDALFKKRFLELDDERKYGEMNARFHRIVVDACGSSTIKTMIDRLNLTPFVAPSVIVFDRIGLEQAFDILFRAHGHHHAIVEAIRNCDEERVEALFREHANQQRISMFVRRASLGEAAAAKPKRRRRTSKMKVPPSAIERAT